VARYKHITAKPTDGGQLFTALSHEFAGPANYVQKLDWRRDLDQEVRREGYDYFSPSGLSDVTGNAVPTSSEINLVHMVRRPNGEVAIIVGTKTHLYRYQKSDDVTYVSGDYVTHECSVSSHSTQSACVGAGANWNAIDYFDNTPDNWITIGSGFSSSGNRWQAVNLNGYTILNNGVDLPVSYRVEHLEVTPLYELRENGVASVGSITAYNGILMLADIDQIDDLKTWMSGGSAYGVVTANTTKFNNRLIWSQIREPLKFSASTAGSISSGEQTLTLSYPAKSYQVGDQITIVGAGTNGGNLSANIAGVTNNQTIFLDAEASTTVSDASVVQTSEIGSIIGFEDLMGDGSGIVHMAPLQNNLVVYKDTSIFIGQYTGNTNIPFKFRVITIPSTQALYYKHTLISVKNTHIYAGRDSFYSFDLTSRGPKEISALASVKDIFYKQNEIAATNSVFAADNVLTNEVWFCFTSLTDDSAICYDYRNGTASTTSGMFSAAASIKKPPLTNEDWFVMGTAGGTLFRYGLANETVSEWSNKKAIYYRRTNSYSTTQVAYPSTIKGGLANFGDAYNEKDFRGYLLQLASQQEENAIITIKIYGYANPYSTPTTLVNGFQITTPATRNLVPCFFRSHLFQDEVTATEYKNARLAARTFDVSMVKSTSEIRQPSLS
jgi:hypothetical protein|tara:strand:+ start:3331 stop:5328 length:1998 start_codon:yes stop_codon:yes gene_type:complete